MSGLRHRPPLLAALAALFLLAGGVGLGFALGARDDAAAPIVRDALAQSNKPRGASGRTLGLSRVTVKPGAEIALHHHAGTQVAFIDSGTLSYTVKTGSVKVMSGPSDDHPTLVRKIDAGTSARIKAGQWIVEQPTTHHQAANRGSKPVVIYLSTLFPIGAPPSIPDQVPVNRPIG